MAVKIFVRRKKIALLRIVIWFFLSVLPVIFISVIVLTIRLETATSNFSSRHIWVIYWWVREL